MSEFRAARCAHVMLTDDIRLSVYRSPMISVYPSTIRLPSTVLSLGEKRKLRAARGSGITATNVTQWKI